MSHPCPRCGVPAPVVVSSDGALPPDLVMADEVSRLREALEQIAQSCQCNGTGAYREHPPCPYCHDSTWDHECPPMKDYGCDDQQCRIARAALATAKGDAMYSTVYVDRLKEAVAAAEARAEKAEGEVRYLRAVVEWRKGLAESETCESCKCSDCQAWLAANPEPQPPEGVAP